MFITCCRAAVGSAGDVDILPDCEHGSGGAVCHLLLPPLHGHLQHGPALQCSHPRPFRLSGRWAVLTAYIIGPALQCSHPRPLRLSGRWAVLTDRYVIGPALQCSHPRPLRLSSRWAVLTAYVIGPALQCSHPRRLRLSTVAGEQCWQHTS